MNIKDSLTKLNSLDGFIGACLVDDLEEAFVRLAGAEGSDAR